MLHAFAQMFSGMQWIPPALLYMVLAHLVGLVCVIVSLAKQNPQFARKGGIAILAAAAVLYPCFDMLTGGLTTEGKALIASPAFTGLAVLALSSTFDP